jgi:hypothetical protein
MCLYWRHSSMESSFLYIYKDSYYSPREELQPKTLYALATTSLHTTQMKLSIYLFSLLPFASHLALAAPGHTEIRGLAHLGNYQQSTPTTLANRTPNVLIPRATGGKNRACSKFPKAKCIAMHYRDQKDCKCKLCGPGMNYR